MHKMKNICRKLSKAAVGEDYFRLLKSLPFNTSFKNVNMIIYNFLKSKVKIKSGCK